MTSPLRRAAATWLGLLSIVATAGAQEIPKPDYITYLPRGTVLPIGQTDASAAFHLFGDTASPAYRDEDPKNGIDDRRDAWFKELGVRFAPWMVRNTQDFPMDFRLFMTSGEPFPLFIDEFDLSHEEPRLVGTSSIDLTALKGDPCRAAGAAVATDTTPDCQLLALIRRTAPGFVPAPKPANPDFVPGYSLYFDFPGRDPESWREEYSSLGKKITSRKYLGYAHTFVHPFVVKLATKQYREPRYELVLQYWFFYPYNDAGNIHEGDWEHLNVFIAPMASITEPPTAETIQRLISGEIPASDLYIRKTEHYFHHWAYPADWTRPNVYLPRAQWQKQVDDTPRERVGEEWIWERTRQYAYRDKDETEINTHPIIYIGGDSRGVNTLLGKPSSLHRASHGSFPYPGLFKDVGPASVGERVAADWDLYLTPPDSNAPETSLMVRLDNPDRVTVIPDWERLLPMVVSDPAVRANWSWMVIPVRFGYPASVSPFAGVVKYAETGNLSIFAPDYNGGWNRIGDGEGYAFYRPNKLNGAYPLSITDNFGTSWGFMNLTLPLLVSLPPFDIAYRGVTAPFRGGGGRIPPTFVNNQNLPFRFIGVSGGVAVWKPSEDYLRLVGFPQTFVPLLEMLESLGSIDNIAGTAVNVETAVNPYVGIDLYLGRHFVSENMFQWGKSGLSEDLTLSNPSRQVSLNTTLDFYQYFGSIRYSLGVGAFQPYVKAGYGLTWYRLEDINLDGETVGPGVTPWVRQPFQPSFLDNILPNTWHLGAGIGYMPVRNIQGIDLGFRAEAVVTTHSLGLQTKENTLLFGQNTRITQFQFNFTGTISY